MKKILFLLGVILMLFISCNSEDIVPDTKMQTKERVSHKVSVEEALERAEAMLNSTPHGQTTRSFNKRMVESVEYFTTGVRTRGMQADTLFYIVNFTNNEGFAMLGADDRELPVYAMSDEGRLSLSDTTYNDGLRFFVNQAVEHANYLTGLGDGYEIDPFNYMLDRTVLPKLSLGARNLNQGPPYNKYCKTDAGELAYAGCAPIAVMGILSYFHVPDKIEDEAIDWDAIENNYRCDALYWLINRIGQSDYLRCKYATYGNKDFGTSTYTSMVAPTLRKLGLNCSDFEPFNKKTAGAQLERAPILIFGLDGGGNHFWVMDGYERYGVSYNVELLPEAASYPHFFFHCCWGWGGYCNGYYYFWRNESINGKADSYANDDNGTSQSLNYWSLKMITGITKIDN